MRSLICLLYLSLSFSVFGQDSQTEKRMDVDWAHPETIDPLREDIGDFLDVDLRTYWEKAYDAYNSKKYKEAARYYLLLLRYDIRDANSIYNLACCYGLLGKDTLAAKYLERSVRAGFEDIEHIKNDPDFEKVRGKDVFDAAVDSIALRIKRKEKQLGDIIHIDAPAFFKCRIHLPENYDSKKSYPLVVGLHGYGSNPDRFITLWEKFGEPEFIYASPQAPYPFPVGKEVGYSWGLGVPGNEKLSDSAAVMSENYITGVVQDLNKRYNVDGVYLLGFSQGCAFTYSTGIKNHHLFKGLICFGGWLNTDWITEESIKAAKDLRVFIAHGKEDRMVEYEKGIKARDTLINYGYDVTFVDFEGGHSVPEEVAKQAVEWLKK